MRRLWRNIPSRISLIILSIMALLALLGPSLSPYTYSSIHLDATNTPPSIPFWFGTDDLGRDIFTRICWGARISLFIGISAALIDGLIGILYGTIAAYFGGKTDECMMRVSDILYAIPYLLVVILLTVVRGSGILTILIAMTCTGWINMARITRSQVLQLKNLDYILAAQSMGASHMRMIFVHLIPNAMGPIIATMTLTIPTAIFTEAFLSFIGLGVQAPAASWGVMVSDSLGAMRYYPWRILFPSIFLTLTMFSFNLLGNSIRDSLDPRLYRS